MQYAHEHEIHADLEGTCSPGFVAALKALGFYDDRFIHPEGGRTPFVPLCHLTIRPANGSEQRQLFQKARDLAISYGKEVEGYLESEVAHVISGFAEMEFNPSVRLLAKVETTFLPAGCFREDEIHVQFDKDRTHPRIAQEFQGAGWRQAFCPEEYGTGDIWTVQGTRLQIEELLPMTLSYLNQVGGLASCAVRREVVAHWWMSRPDLPLPPVIAAIQKA